jgi:catalase-peroxidase
MENMNNQGGKCPFSGGRYCCKSNLLVLLQITEWWPNQLRLNVLRQHSSLSNPMGETLIMLKRSKP